MTSTKLKFCFCMPSYIAIIPALILDLLTFLYMCKDFPFVAPVAFLFLLPYIICVCDVYRGLTSAWPRMLLFVGHLVEVLTIMCSSAAVVVVLDDSKECDELDLPMCPG